MNDTLKRVLAVLPLIPAILWMMFAGPAWTFLALVLGATLIIGFELARMIAPGEALLQSIVIVGTIAVASTRLYTDDPQIMQGVMIGVAILTLVGALIRPDPVEKAALRIGWMFGARFTAGCFSAPSRSSIVTRMAAVGYSSPCSSLGFQTPSRIFRGSFLESGSSIPSLARKRPSRARWVG